MADELDRSRLVTEFLLNTCLQRRLNPLPNDLNLQAVLHCAAAVSTYSRDQNGVDYDAIPLTTGSVAEFYIEPMLPNFGDIDVMYHQDNELAIPLGYPSPTQLPAEFHNDVHVWIIIDVDVPGYVYLLGLFSLTKYDDSVNYRHVDYHPMMGKFLANCPEDNTEGIRKNGPANYFQLKETLSLDQVPCVRCLVWPPQAADWPTRHRNYGWPDSATLDRVVNNGCDVVPVAHRQYRHHARMVMRMGQHRLSFSRAEIVLINSWTPVQQIVYHMLRYFIKAEQLTVCVDNSGAGTLSNYHIKTLMLWACELKQRSWWTDDLNLIRLCVHLMHVLGKWLSDGRCKHYVINNCNLIDNSFNVTNIGDQLMSIDETWLSTWFVDNYIRACSQLTPNQCPQFVPKEISRLFDDVCTSMKLQNATSALVDWRRNSSLLYTWLALNGEENNIPASFSTWKLTPRSCNYWMTALANSAKIDSRLLIYFKAVALLNVSYRSQRHGFNDDLMDILATLFGQFCSRSAASQSSLRKTVEFMEMFANKSLNTISLIEIELSKAYLYRALRCKDSDSDSIYCLANVYLAVLYYTTGQYQTAIDHCTLVTKSQDHSQCSSHVVQGDILSKIDDDVDNMLGLAALYQHVRTAALKQKRQPQTASVLTTELFAYYLHIKCLSVTKCHQFMPTSSTDEFKRYAVCISDTQQLFIDDALLFLSLSRVLKFRHRSICPATLHPLMNEEKCNTSDLVELLQKSAVEHLTTYRQLEAQEFGSVIPIVTTDFEALYAYKRGDYERCLQLSKQQMRALFNAVYMPSVQLLPEFIQFMDDDIVSLTALIWLTYHCDREISDLVLSLYLMTQCQLKLRHPVMSVCLTIRCIMVTLPDVMPHCSIDRLVLKMCGRKAIKYCRSFGLLQ